MYALNHVSMSLFYGISSTIDQWPLLLRVSLTLIRSQPHASVRQSGWSSHSTSADIAPVPVTSSGHVNTKRRRRCQHSSQHKLTRRCQHCSSALIETVTSALQVSTNPHADGDVSIADPHKPSHCRRQHARQHTDTRNATTCTGCHVCAARITSPLSGWNYHSIASDLARGH